MPDRIGVSQQGAVAVVRIDNPPVNALGRDVAAELAAAVRRLASDASVEALVMHGAGKTFVAGADIRELEAAAWTTPSSRPTSTSSWRSSRTARSRS